MSMRKHMVDIYKVFSTDETLLRLLYYKPENAADDPLDSSKPNILDMTDKWDIIQDRIKTTSKVDDLDDEAKCRLLFYSAGRNGTNNYLVADQEIKIDLLVHYYFEDVDLRMSWICDRVNELMFDQRITGYGKVDFKNGKPISAPNGYVGYQLLYQFGSGK